MKPSREHAIKQYTMAVLEAHAFRPAWWLRGRHAQTIWGPTVRMTLGRFAMSKVRHERWDTPDEDFLDLLFLDGNEGAPQVVLFHGMEGTPKSYYIPGYARHFKRFGWAFTTMFFRSCGLGMNRTAKLYHLGATKDPEFVLKKFRERHPEKPLFAIGVSLGGNVLAKWLGEQGEAARQWVDGAAIVSPPFDPVAAAPRFHKELYGLYARYFVKTLTPKALEVARRFPEMFDEDAIKQARDFYSFDTAFTAKLAGYKEAEDYRAHTGCGQFLEGIRVPTLLISAKDDPFILPESMPVELANESPYLYPQFPDNGGHVGFVAGTAPGFSRYWYEDQTLRFFETQLRLRRSGIQRK